MNHKEIKSINPYTNEVIASTPVHSKKEINSILEKANKVFHQNKDMPIDQRARKMMKAADILRENVNKYATTISSEMGKPICEARGEVEKCAWACEFYAENSETFLADEIIETDAFESFISYDPIGCVLAIMPWNFPFWQVFRFAAPALMAGNVGILKHASNVLGCAKHIEEIFLSAGFDEGMFQNIFAGHEAIEEVIAHEAIKAVTLTGSEKAGSSVAAIAGKFIKKSVLELGGNNAFVVLKDANIKEAVQTGVKARMQNGGQSCIAAKRFIVVEKVYDKFLKGFVEATEKLKSGQPLDDTTEIGTLAKEEFAEGLYKQLEESVAKGAKVLTGGNYKGAYFEPTVVSNVSPGMPLFDEETFGPVAPIIKAKDEAEAFELAGNTKYGLGTTVFTSDINHARKQVSKIADGALFINELVKSDPRLPFGGTGASGYGRELSREGMLEFMNIKTVYVKA